MRGVFDENELVSSQPRHDTELTLSNTTLLLIFFGLVLLCGVCFGLGYAVGHHGAPDASASLPAAAGQSTLHAGSDLPKPSATSTTSSPRPPQAAPDPPVAAAGIRFQHSSSVNRRIGPSARVELAARGNNATPTNKIATEFINDIGVSSRDLATSIWLPR